MGFFDLQMRIEDCRCCVFVKSFEGEGLPEHGLSSHWSWWFRNKWPIEGGFYYTFFKWDGFSNVVFITLRPSTEWVPDTADFFFANALKVNGLVREVFKFEGDTFIFYEGVLVTDLVKCKGKAKEVVEKVPEKCLAFIREELDIVRKYSGREPRIIAVGKKSRELLYEHRIDIGIKAYKSVDDIPWIYLHNYAEWQGKRMKRIEAFKKYVNQIREAISKAKPIN